jgi:AraC-like DNA-binding protein
VDKIVLIKILYAAASIQGVFLAFLLVRTKVNQPANKILALVLVILSFHLVLVGFDEREFFMAFPHLSKISWIIGTLYGPLIFLFIQQLTGSRVAWYWIVGLFVPFLIVLLNLLPYYWQSAELKRAYLDAFETARLDDFGWINQFVSFVQVAFVFGNLGYYLFLERKQSQEFSSIDAIRIQWLRQFLTFLVAITVFGVVIFFARIWEIGFLSGLYRFHFIGVVFLFYWLSYRALTRPVLFGLVRTDDAPVPVQAESKSTRPDVASGQVETVFHAVKAVLEQEKLYLKSDLTLTELANRSGYGRNQVSQAINTSFRGNFFDFVNDFRVEEFKAQALNPNKRHLTQLGIALESGFNSKASFYSIFKKKTGMTPAEFVEQRSKSVLTSPEG